MKIFFIDRILTKLINGLESFGKFVNQNPTIEEAKRITTSPLFKQPFWKKLHTSIPKALKQRIHKDVYAHTGSGYKGKGNINTDSATFNQPRKSGSAGRRN